MEVTTTEPWLEGIPLASDKFRTVREETIFGCGKWDAQVGDVSVLHDTPLVLRADSWAEISSLAEGLARETVAAEAELRRRPELHRRLGLGWRLRRALRCSAADGATTPFHVLRFDFHWTDNGWRVSEVNSDVPGGFIEASGFTRLFAAQVDGAVATGDPTALLSDAIARWVTVGGTVGLVHATAYTDDRQVMQFLQRSLRKRGIEALLLSPRDVRWAGRQATGHDGRVWRKLDLIHRFFPAEWLPNLGWFAPWNGFFGNSDTPQVNPPSALLTQSKRFPLAWDALETELPLWRNLLPETCDPRERERRGGEWVLKPALGRVGEGIDLSGVTAPAERAKIQREARRRPHEWAAQRRFNAVPWSTQAGSLFPAIGVYVIDGHAAGIYARAAQKPLVDSHAFDIAVLVEDDSTTLSLRS